MHFLALMAATFIFNVSVSRILEAQESVDTKVLEVSQEENVVSGSWATIIGGTLEPANFNALESSSLKRAKFSRIQRNVGFGVLHEFIALTIETESLDPKNPKRDHYVTGLNNDSDLEFFKSSLDKSQWKSKSAKREYEFTDGGKVLEVIEEINEITKSTPYRDPIAYATAMAGRPFFGQPCSIMSSILEKKIRAALKP